MNRSLNLSIITYLFVVAGPLLAQDSSLLRAVSENQRIMPATIENSSFIYQPLPPEAQERPLQMHDVITVLVDYRSTTLSEGSNETIKTGAFSSVLTDWLAFDGNSIFPAPQRRGDPTVGGTVNSQLRAEADIETRESLTFPIAVEIVDIRPNQNLVIEGRRRIQVNEEVWETYLTGTVPRQAIGQDRVVREDSISNLRIDKREYGSVRDGSSRGWLQRWYGKYKAF